MKPTIITKDFGRRFLGQLPEGSRTTITHVEEWNCAEKNYIAKKQ